MKGLFKGIVVLVIGGVAYSVSQADIVDNFSKDTGLSKEQAEQYVENVSEDDLVSFEQLGINYISDGQEMVSSANEIDCVNNEYEWETYSLSCEEGKSQIKKFGNSEIAVGNAYKKLGSDSASTSDISLAITLIDELNANYSLTIIRQVLDYSTIDESKKINSFNKAILQSALDSDQSP